MKKIISILLILFVFSSLAMAGPVKRIKFAKGATKVSVTATLKSYKDSQIFLIRLRKGQKITLQATRSVSLFITDPNGEDVSDMDLSCHSSQTVENTIAGDYKIKAVQCGKTDEWKGSFKLTIEVTSLTEITSLISQAQNSNSTLQKSIDVTVFNQKIELAKKKYETNTNSVELKNNLATTYFERAFVLTDAAQYKSALGDFRKGLKLNPNDVEAKAMHDRIISIYKALGREVPKEGEEPPPINNVKKPSH